jgi:regulator of ribonuclease activity A
MTIKTADLYDAHGDQLAVAAPIFRSYGAKPAFFGQIATLRCFEDNKSARDALNRGGAGKVLVIDGGGSLRTALVGGLIAALAVEKGWQGIVVNGCVRDSVEINGLDLGVRALATNPTRPQKRVDGELDVPVVFAGITFRPGEWLYADEDGIVVTPEKLA